MNKQLSRMFVLCGILCSTAVLLSSCNKDETYNKASVETNEISLVSEATANCLGIVSSDGGSTITARGFCWSTSPLPTIENDTIRSATGTPEFTGTLKGLAPATRYYVRAFAINQGGVAYGVNMLFTTKTFAVATSPISVVMLTATSAIGGGSILSDGDSTILTIKERGICWNTYPTPTIENSRTIDGCGGGRFTSKMDSLKAFTTYYVRAYATNGNGTIYGDEVSFTTLNGIVGLSTNPITSITAFTASANGRFTTDGGAATTERGICWNTSPNPTTEFSKVVSDNDNDTIKGNLTGLLPGTTYYVRTYAVNCVGTSYGDEVSFTTQDGTIGLTTKSASTTSAFGSTSGGSITSDGGAPVTERGICWNSSQNPTTADNKIVCGSGLGTYSTNITGLTPGTTYFVRSYGINSLGTTYGNQIGFLTLNGVITLTTNAVMAITTTSGNCVGTISADGGGGAITERGICWSTSANPTTANNKLVNSFGMGSYTVSMTGLTPGTTYYVRAYGVNSLGTSYGNQVSFTTKNGVVELTTTAVSSVTTSTAKSGATITSNGGLTITSSGICWSTSANPTIANNKTTNGTASGTYISIMDGLTGNTTYYVRAWATNSSGTSYGNQVSFKTPSATGTLTDIDGNVYHYITIGTQTWMVENLKTTKYRDGTAIPNVTNAAQWSTLTTGAYCSYNNDATNADTYGYLYNWNAVSNARNIAPAGWHVPTREELMALGEIARNGGKLKEVGTTHWESPNTDATDSLGFKALPGGYRNSAGNFYNIGKDGRWWTTYEVNTDQAWHLYLFCGNSFMDLTEIIKKNGLSVRCLRD